ncbi:hypothetical protein ACFWVU_18480 [Streptomyces sp. NPDC058686]|uniref:hypothetical protein n=1 Tax=Streptomyces sp. NPDC058686 TaxID=3346599 RepID=UPI003669840C
MKLCPTCGENKDETEFNKNSRRKDGLQVECKTCQRTRNSAAQKKLRKTRDSINDPQVYETASTLLEQFTKDMGVIDVVGVAHDLREFYPEASDLVISDAVMKAFEKLVTEMKEETP